jgi:hypothetical protein
LRPLPAPGPSKPEEDLPHIPQVERSRRRWIGRDSSGQRFGERRIGH